MPLNVLVVDDEEGVRESLSLILKMEGYYVSTSDSAVDALARVESGEEWDFIISDIRMPEMDGLQFLEEVGKKNRATDVIMISAYGNIETSLKAVSLGAADYINKPINPEELILRMRMIEERNRLKKENTNLKRELGREVGFDSLIFACEAMREIVNYAHRVSEYKTTVLITGESGTGKEVLARSMHEASPRSDKPFVAVNCSAIPATLIESELFGYVKGAFSGASGTKKGLIEEAETGTLFLDEIGNLPLSLQPKLLRFLQEEEIRRLGDTHSRSVDVRIVAATSRDLAFDIKDGSFRDDLFYRLNVVPIHLPPLRERKDDIPMLVDHFIDKYNDKFNRAIKGISKNTLARFLEYPWKGNVRELENVIERAIILSDSDIIEDVALPEQEQAIGNSISVDSLSLDKAWQKLEFHLINKALNECAKNRTKAAKLLGISRRALIYKLKQYGINP